MNLFKKKFERIKNAPQFTIRKDFKFNAISFFIYILCIGGGVFGQLTFSSTEEVQMIIMLALTLVVVGLITAIIPSWITIINLSALVWLLIVGKFGGTYIILGIAGTAGLIISSSIQLILQWDKVVVLRLGKFKKTHGPGLIILIPLIDRIAEFIDTRIRVTDFSAEKTLTTDTVPVHVDALAFWMIWDAKSAVLEVENYVEAVILSAQTALRDAIGKHELSSLLSEREELGKEIQMALDAKTTPWGVSILSIEITDIIIPKELENAMSKRAQAEREKQSRVILAEAEVSVAEKFTEAAKEYDSHPQAMQLRAMNMIYEGIRQNNSMMLMPASILDSMNLGNVLSTAALQKSVKLEKESKEDSDDSNN